MSIATNFIDMSIAIKMIEKLSDDASVIKIQLNEKCVLLYYPQALNSVLN